MQSSYGQGLDEPKEREFPLTKDFSGVIVRNWGSVLFQTTWWQPCLRGPRARHAAAVFSGPGSSRMTVRAAGIRGIPATTLILVCICAKTVELSKVSRSLCPFNALLTTPQEGTQAAVDMTPHLKRAPGSPGLVARFSPIRSSNREAEDRLPSR
jgi:hypothetical protein